MKQLILQIDLLVLGLRYITLFMWIILYVILYMVHNRAFFVARSQWIAPQIFYKTNQLLSDYSLACQYHIDDTDPTLLMHIAFLIRQVPCTGYFWYPVHKTKSSFWSNSGTLELSRKFLGDDASSKVQI